MKHHISLLVAFLLGCLLMAPVVSAGDIRWHELSLRGFAGGVQNGGHYDSRPGYSSFDMGSEVMYGGGFSMIFEDWLDLDFALSMFDNQATQIAENGQDHLEHSLRFIQLSVTGKRLYPMAEGLFRPWWGGGLDVGQIKDREAETVVTPAGTISRGDMVRDSTAFGAHGAAGIDVYPIKQSAFALTAEVRYSYYFSTGPFEGNLNGLAYFAGIRWDFFQRGM